MLDDIDSDPDSTLTNDNLFEDDEINENGKNNGDEDDHDIEEIDVLIFDLALRKELPMGDPSSVAPGEDVDFQITVFNQGEIVADSITIYDFADSDFFIFNPGDNPDWMQVGSTDTIIRSINTPINPGSSFTVNLTLQVRPDLGSGVDITNVAEIAEAQDTFGRVQRDLDSQADTIPDNEMNIEDDEIDEDGMNGNDEDDHDIEVIRTIGFDLALYKQLTPGQNSQVAPGDTVSFRITVVNQGDIHADNITIIDSFPDGLEMIIDPVVNPDWADVGGGLYSYQFANANGNLPAEGLAPSTDTFVDVRARVALSNGANTVLTNSAEIGFATDTMDQVIPDFDSRRDSVLSNDLFIEDNDITGDAINNVDDEDDHDREDITVLPFDLALTKIPILPADGSAGQGDTVGYKITVINQGLIGANEIRVIDSFPDE
jgi:uncharacterized repeat protein (TIGR01451 family)